MTLKSREIPKIGLIPLNQWEVYEIKNKSGLFLVKNPFTPLGQKFWIRKILEEYTKSNPNNLLPSRFNKNVIENFWKSWSTESDEQQKRLIKKSMRWTTLGYHYDWTNKIYDENFKNEFPQELQGFVKIIADSFGYENYKSEAAIVNFYPIGSTLSPHTDHSEFFLKSPLFSISFGQPAIFLIGGTEREHEADSILLQSGDIIVMSGESRLFYHAVPRVFADSCKVWNDNEEVSQCTNLPSEYIQDCLKQSKWKVFEHYLEDSRINLNIRQVNK
jgi:alkylated DNA repair protein alkB homolog 1